MPRQTFEHYHTHLGGRRLVFNATISPFVPMRLAGFVVWLGESYVFASSQPRAVLGCLFKRFVTDLRLIFGLWSAYFGFVRLSSFCEHGTNLSLPFLRHTQMQMLDLPNVGYAVAEDANSAPCDIHPSMANKRVVGTRLAGSALDILFYLAMMFHGAPRSSFLSIHSCAILSECPCELMPRHRIYRLTSKHRV
jgi:hypothetical protein